MSGMKDLLADEPPAWAYPASPGFKEPTTSRAAAGRIAPRAGELRARILAALADRPMTGSELEEALGVDKGTVRPRLSELRVDKRARPRLTCAGRQETRPNRRGSREIVWEPGAEPEEG